MLDGISIEMASENLAECTPFLMYFQFLDTTFPKKKNYMQVFAFTQLTSYSLYFQFQYLCVKLFWKEIKWLILTGYPLIIIHNVYDNVTKSWSHSITKIFICLTAVYSYALYLNSQKFNFSVIFLCYYVL